MENDELRTTFEQAAQDYDEARPGYPTALVQDVISLSGIPEKGSIIEVGCGTGQATVPFAEYGYRMVCLDIGEELASLAALKCRCFPDVHVRTVSFEDWVGEPGAFDLLVSASAFHWIPADLAYAKTASVLKDSGSMALFWNLHPDPLTPFFEDVQEVYRKHAPGLAENVAKRANCQVSIEKRTAQINASGHFEMCEVRRYPWTAEYRAHEYAKLLNTYSDHRKLDEAKREALLLDIAELVERHGGMVARPYLAVLYLAKKRR